MGRHRKGNGKRRKALGIDEAQRSCVACRQRRPAQDLIRFVRGPEGTLGVDLAKSMPGRGAWLCAKPGCLSHGLKKGAFARALEGAIANQVDDFLPYVERVLFEAAASRLGLAYRAGHLLAGREKVFTGLKNGEVSLVICSYDLSERSRKEVAVALADFPEVPLLIGLGQEATGAAMGRSNTGVLGLTEPTFGRTLESSFGFLNEWLGRSHLSDFNGDLLGMDAPVMGESLPSQMGSEAPQRSV